MDVTENNILENNGNSEIKTFEECLRHKTIEMKQLDENYKFKLQQQKLDIAELQIAISQVS